MAACDELPCATSVFCFESDGSHGSPNAALHWNDARKDAAHGAGPCKFSTMYFTTPTEGGFGTHAQVFLSTWQTCKCVASTALAYRTNQEVLFALW